MLHSEGNTGNTALAVIYFASGLTFCGMNMMCISAIPDCAGAISPQFLTLLAALLLASAIAVLPSTFVVPCIIGIADDVLVDGEATQLCAFILRFAQLTASFFYMLIIFQRNIELRWHTLSSLLFSQSTIFIYIAVVICVAFIDALLNTRNGSALYFDTLQLLWTKSESILVQDQITAMVFLIVVFVLYSITALYFIVEQFFGNIHEKMSRNQSSNDLAKLALYFLCDIIFAILSAYVYINPTRRNLFERCSSNGALLGYIQSFGQPAWPAISTFLYCIPLRQAILTRLNMMVASAHTSKRSTPPLRKLSIKASASPVFQLFVKHKKETNGARAQAANMKNIASGLRTVPIIVLSMGT